MGSYLGESDEFVSKISAGDYQYGFGEDSKREFEKNSSSWNNKIMETTSLKQRFYKVFANLPLNLREEVILVLEKRGPITWQVAYLEVDNETELGKIILQKLAELEII